MSIVVSGLSPLSDSDHSSDNITVVGRTDSIHSSDLIDLLDGREIESSPSSSDTIDVSEDVSFLHVVGLRFSLIDRPTDSGPWLCSGPSICPPP